MDRIRPAPTGRRGFLHPAGEENSAFDKWKLLETLTEAAEEFELSYRALTVLKALLTFLPARDIPADSTAATVFPSNKTLSTRLSGMPESTMRRHLASLVKSGVIRRQTSPNGKRYAHRLSGATELAFGFDLSPMREQAGEMQVAAERAQRAREELCILRDQLLRLAQELVQIPGVEASELREAIRLTIRRKASAEDLRALISAALNLAGMKTESCEMSGQNSQNERHIQESKEYDSDSGGGISSPCPGNKTQTTTTARPEQPMTLAEVTSTCREYQLYFPNGSQTWPQLFSEADAMVPMVGIEPSVFAQAKRIMGQGTAAVTVLCIIERISGINNPGGYLRRLTQKAQSGEFSVKAMLRGLRNRRPAGNCQLTI